MFQLEPGNKIFHKLASAYLPGFKIDFILSEISKVAW